MKFIKIKLKEEDALASFKNFDEQTKSAIRNYTLPETWPKYQDIKIVKNGFFYTLERDAKTESQEVLRYRIKM